jgi:hypothetical protein
MRLLLMNAYVLRAVTLMSKLHGCCPSNCFRLRRAMGGTLLCRGYYKRAAQNNNEKD